MTREQIARAILTSETDASTQAYEEKHGLPLWRQALRSADAILALHQQPAAAQPVTADQRQKIAEALVESYYGGAQTWNFSNEYTRDTFLRLADAALTALERQNLNEIWNEALRACIEAQPATAENPNEDAYQRGYFDGVMAYGRVIIALDKPVIAEQRQEEVKP